LKKKVSETEKQIAILQMKSSNTQTGLEKTDKLFQSFTDRTQMELNDRPRTDRVKKMEEDMDIYAR